MKRAWLALGGGLCLSGCGVLIGIEPIEVTGTGGGDASGSSASSSASVTTGAGGVATSGASGHGGGGCSSAGMECAACAGCGEVVDVVFDDYRTLPSFHGSISGASRSGVGLVTGCTQASGPERIYAVHPKFDGYLTASLVRATTTFDSVLYARKGPDCCTTTATPLCADSSTGTPGALFGGEVISFRVAQSDVWYIFVDGVDAAHGQGDYELVLSHASGVKCDSGPILVPIELGSKMTLLGDAQNLGDPGENCGQCGVDLCDGMGSEAIYQITAPPSVHTLQIALDPKTTLYDSVLYARTACGAPATQILCQDIVGPGSNSGEKLKLNNTGLPLFVFVDTHKQPAPSYDYTLTVTPGP